MKCGLSRAPERPTEPTDIFRRTTALIAAHEFWLWWAFGAPLLLASSLPRWLLGAALCLIPCFWLARRAAFGVWSVTTPADVPLALLLLLGVMGVAVSPERAASLEIYAGWLGIAAVYYAVANSTTRERLPLAVWLLLLVGAGMAVVGLLGLRASDKFLPPTAVMALLPRLDVELLNPRGFTPNLVAGAIAPLIPLAVGVGLWRAGWQRVAAWSIALGTFAVVLLTQSRGALLGLALGLAIVALGRLPRVWQIVAAGALLIGGAVGLSQRVLIESVLASDPGGSAASRLELWNRALLILRDFPFTGAGWGQFSATVAKLYPLFVTPLGDPIPHAHNMYLQMGVDLGAGGMAAFVGALAAVLAAAVWNVRASRGEARNWLALGLLGGLAVILVHNLLDAVMTSIKVGFTAWFLMALVVVLARVMVGKSER